MKFVIRGSAPTYDICKSAETFILAKVYYHEEAEKLRIDCERTGEEGYISLTVVLDDFKVLAKKV